MVRTEPVASDSEAAHVASVRRYYEDNTGLFVRFGQGRDSIHRAVWGPGVTTRQAAMHWIDDLIVTEIRRTPAATTVLDLGCGVGASLLHAAERTPAHGTGITLSPVQCERANALFESSGVATRMRARVGDFHELPVDLRGIDLAFSIEAFGHSASAARFFASVTRVLRPGGRLLLCDDFVEQAKLSGRKGRLLEDFRSGWRMGALLRVDEIEALAAGSGLALTDNRNLTPYLELRRPRDLAIGLAVKLAKVFKVEGSYFSALKGGDALQLALESGALAYRVLVFQRRGPETS